MPRAASDLDHSDTTHHPDIARVDADEGQEVLEPESLLCPITKIVFKDPVFVPESGFTYERSALEQFWRLNSNPLRDPNTNVALTSREVFTNWDKRRDVHAFLDQHATYTPEGWTSREIPAPNKAHVDRLQHTNVVGEGWAKKAGAIALIALALSAGVGYEGVSGQSSEGSSNTHRGSTVNRGTSSPMPSSNTSLQSPVGGRVLVVRQPNFLSVTFPPLGVDGAVIANSMFAVFWTGFTGVWTSTALMQGAPYAFAAFSLPFWAIGAFLGKTAIKPAVSNSTISLDANNFSVISSMCGWNYSIESGQLRDLRGARVVHTNDESQAMYSHVELQEGILFHHIGVGHNIHEQEYVAQLINRFLVEHLPVRL